LMEIIEDRNITQLLLPILGPNISGSLIEEDWGIYPAASYMPEDMAWDVIIRVFEKFCSNLLPYVPNNNSPG